MPGIGLTIPVRIAKAKLSALLELVAAGQRVTITSDGQPKAVLSPVAAGDGRKRFADGAGVGVAPAWRNVIRGRSRNGCSPQQQKQQQRHDESVRSHRYYGTTRTR